MNGYLLSLLLLIFAVICYGIASGRIGMRKEYQDEEEGYADILRYARPIQPGVMLGKGGELIAGFFYRGTDTESASVNELEMISARLNDALRRQGSGWMVHIDANRASAIGYPENSHFTDPVSALMDAEREEQYSQEGAHFESAYAMVFTYLPPLEMESKATALMFENSDDLKTDMKSLQTQLLERFNDALGDIHSQMSTVFDGITRMGEQVVTSRLDGSTMTIDHLSGYLHFCATGINQHIVVPPRGVMYDSIIGSQDFTGGNTPAVGEKNIRCIAIDGFPATSHSGILTALNSLPIAYRWSTRFIFMDPEEGKSLWDKLRKKWRQKVRGLRDQASNSTSGPVDHDALEMEGDASVAMALSTSGLVRFGHYTSVIVLLDENEARLKQAVDDCATLIRNLGFSARIEKMNAVEAFLGTLPGHGYENVRRPILHSLNVAHLIPTTATWPGLAKNPCQFFPPNSPPLALARTTGNAPFRLNLHVDDVGHGMLLGPTGAGKSSFLEFMEASFLRFPNGRVRKIEKGYSSFILCNAVKGAYYDLGGENGSAVNFCPLANVDQAVERAWAEEYIETLLTLQKFDVFPIHRKAVRDALTRMGEGAADRRTMTDFCSTVQDVDIRTALAPYTLGGGNEMLDAEADSFSFKRFVVFEMEHLMRMGDKHVIPVLLYLFRCIERDLDGSPTLIVLDEAWLMLKHELFKEKIEEWLRTLRKANCSVWFATQSISDVGKSTIKDVLFDSCPTKILLANAEAKNEEASAPYKALGMNDRQINIIGNMTKKLDYYYMSPLGRRRFQLGLGPVCMAFVGCSGKDDIAKARQLMTLHGDRWPVEWLNWCNETKDWGKGRLSRWSQHLQTEYAVKKAA